MWAEIKEIKSFDFFASATTMASSALTPHTKQLSKLEIKFNGFPSRVLREQRAWRGEAEPSDPDKKSRKQTQWHTVLGRVGGEKNPYGPNFIAVSLWLLKSFSLRSTFGGVLLTLIRVAHEPRFITHEDLHFVRLILVFYGGRVNSHRFGLSFWRSAARFFRTPLFWIQTLNRTAVDVWFTLLSL